MSANAVMDPQSRAILDMIAASGRPPLHEAGVEAAREGMRASRLLLGAPVPPTRCDDIDAGGVPVRLYRPLVAPGHSTPLLVFFHGGGWVLGDVETGDAFCGGLVDRLGIAVASVDYRLAPEHPFPAAVEDAAAALDWLAAHAAALDCDAGRLAVAGDSAGGNLAAVCALRSRDGAGPPLRAQVLLYPVTDLTMASGSYRRNAEGYLLTARTMHWFRQLYLQDADPRDWRASPLHVADVAGVAPALVVTCGFDPLCDEGAAYAGRLRAAGVPVRHRAYDDQVHGFAMWGKDVAAAAGVLNEVTDELRRHLCDQEEKR